VEPVEHYLLQHQEVMVYPTSSSHLLNCNNNTDQNWDQNVRSIPLEEEAALCRHCSLDFRGRLQLMLWLCPLVLVVDGRTVGLFLVVHTIVDFAVGVVVDIGCMRSTKPMKNILVALPTKMMLQLKSYN
jgi:hypothetical protein